MSDSLGDRMKSYESSYFRYLLKRTPVILRLDACACHTWTRGLEKPFDIKFNDCMVQTALILCTKISGARMAYTQSDEISILLIDYENIETEAWFNNRANKIESVSASIATASFNEAASTNLPEHSKKKNSLYFDSRAFNLPKEEVCNYFIWRMNDCTRNSIQSLGQANFSHKELQNMNNKDVQDMLMLKKGINWNDTITRFKRGTSIYKKQGGSLNAEWFVDYEIPIITKNRQFIEKWVFLEKGEDNVKKGY